MIRVGIGIDSHRFVDGKKNIMLGGLEVPFEKGMKAHSDGDVILHSLYNAISSALGLGSIGKSFPDNEKSNLNRDSSDFIKYITDIMKQKNFSINNISISIEAKTPKIDPIIEKIKLKLSKLLKIKTDAIGITATTGEELSDFGKGFGIQVVTIVSLIGE